MKSDGSSNNLGKDEREETVNGGVQAVSMEKLTVTDEEEQHELDKKHRQCLSERKRKDRIKSGIQKIGQLLPLSYRSEKESAIFLLEQASIYIKDLQKQVDRFLLEDGDQVKADEIKRLREENDSLRQDIASLKDILQTGAFQSLGCNKGHDTSAGDLGVSPSSTSDAKSPSESSTTSKRRKLVSQHLECRKTLNSDEPPMLNGTPCVMTSQNSVLVSPEAGIPLTSGSNMSFMNQLFFSPSNTSGIMNCSSDSLLDESSLHSRSNNGGLIAESSDSVSHIQDVSTAQSSATDAVSSSSGLMATSQLQQSTLTVSTNSFSQPLLSQQVLGPQMNSVPVGTPQAGSVNPAGSGQIQGTLVIHNGQLLLVNPQLQSNGPVQSGQAPVKPVGSSGLVVSGAQGPLMATSTGQPVIPQNTLLTTTQMVTRPPNPALIAGPGGQATSQVSTRPAVNLNMNMPAIRNAMGQTIIPNAAPEQSNIVNAPQGLPGVQGPQMLNQQTLAIHGPQPSSLPSALLLPNGQIVPVVTQPNLMVQAPTAPQQLAAGAGLVASANSPVRLPMMGAHPQTVINNGMQPLPTAVQPQSVRMSTSSVITSSATQTPVLSAGTMRLYTPGTNTIHHVPSSLSSSQPLPQQPNLVRPSPAINPPVAPAQPHPANINQQVCIAPPANQSATNSTNKVNNPPQPAVSTPASLSGQQLPATVAAVLTPEGNIILTFTQSGPTPCVGTQAGKKGGPRTLMPKPLTAVSRANTPVDVTSSKSSGYPEMSVAEKTPPVQVSDASNTVSATVPSTSAASMTPLSISITTVSTSSGLSSNTDILAKAAESIFASASPSDMSPSISGFYNPAHDDNPLHIDTGNGESENLKDAGNHVEQLPDSLNKNKVKPKNSKSSKPRSSKSNKKKKQAENSEAPADAATSDVAADPKFLNSTESSGFMEHITGGGEKMEEEESDINDFSDLIKLHEPEMLVNVNPKTKDQSLPVIEEPKVTESQVITSLSYSASVVPVATTTEMKLVSPVPSQPDIVHPSNSVATISNPISTASTMTCEISRLSMVNTSSAEAPLLSMPDLSSMVASTNTNVLEIVPSVSSADCRTSKSGNVDTAPPVTVTSQFVLPPALQSSYIALPPASHTMKEKHKKHKHKKKDRCEGSKSKKKSKEDKKASTAEMPPMLDHQTMSSNTVQAHDFPPDLSKDPPLRTSTPPPVTVLPLENHKSKPKKSKSKSKSKKKKHKDHDLNESVVSSTECESTLTTSVLDSSTDSQKEQVLMEIQNELAAQIPAPVEPQVCPESKKTEESQEAARLFWEKEIVQRNSAFSKGKEENVEVLNADVQSAVQHEAVASTDKKSQKKSRKNSKPKKKDQSQEISIEAAAHADASKLTQSVSVDTPNEAIMNDVHNKELDPLQQNRKRKVSSSQSNKSKVRPEDVIPEQITFSENDLADVLSQVESYGETLVQENTPKKSRSKKSKSAPTAEEMGPPPFKKRKDGDIIEGPLSGSQDEKRISSQPPPPALADNKEKKKHDEDVFAFTEDDDDSKSGDKAKQLLQKPRKRGGKSKFMESAEQSSVSVCEGNPNSPLNKSKSSKASNGPLATSSSAFKSKEDKTGPTPQSMTLKSPDSAPLPIHSPPPLITDCSQSSAPSPSQVSPAKNLFDLPNLMTPSVPIPIEDVDRGSSRDDAIIEDYELTTPSKITSSNDNAMNEAIDSLCRILPSPGKERDIDGESTKNKTVSLPVDFDEPPPTPGQARHNNLVSLAGHVSQPRKSSASAKSKSSSSKLIQKHPPVLDQPSHPVTNKPDESTSASSKSTKEDSLSHIKEQHSEVTAAKKSSAPARFTSSEKSQDKGTDQKLSGAAVQQKDDSLLKAPASDKVTCQQSPRPSNIVQNYSCERNSGYNKSLHHSPASKAKPDKSPRSNEQRKTPQQIHAPVDGPASAGASSVPAPGMRPLEHSSAPPLQHENFSSCMAQSTRALRHEKELYSPPPLSTATSSSSCAVQTGKSPADAAFSYSPHYPLAPGPNMGGTVQQSPAMQSYCLPVTSGTNTFSFSLSPSHSVTTTSSAVMNSYDQHIQSSPYSSMYQHPTPGSMPPQNMPAHTQSGQHLPSAPPTLGFPPMEASGGSKPNSSCAAVATASCQQQLHPPTDRPPTAGATQSSSGTIRPRRDSQPGADKQHNQQSSNRSSQQTSPYGNFIGSSNASQQQKSNVMQNYPENQTPNTMSRQSKSSSGNRSSSGSVGRSPQMAQAPKDTPTQFLSPTGGAYQVTGVGSSSNTLTSPPLHHHGPAVSTHRSSSSGGSSSQRTSHSSASSHYGSFPNATASFGPISAFGAQAFDPPALQFGGMSSGRESRSASGSTTPAYAASSSASHNNQKQSSSSKSVGGSSSSKQSSGSSSQQGQHKSSSSRSSSKKNKSKQSSSSASAAVANPYEMDSSLFDPNRVTPAYFPLSGLSPPPQTRNLQGDGPTYLPNFLNNHGRAGPLSHNSNTLQHKDPSMGHHPFMFGHPTRGPQNGIGLNFAQAGFGMNAMHHSNHVSTSQLTPHTNSVSVTPHMPNFNLTNIFSDMNNPAAQAGTDGLNISPIKFATGNGLLGAQTGMEHNLQHAHQAAAGAMYHNPRGSQMPPHHMLPSMNINSLLSHQHPGFEAAARGVAPSISSTMTPPFGGGHSHAHSFGMPTLNFQMHDH